MPSPDTKTCRECKKTQPMEAFSKDPSTTDGMRRCCRACDSEGRRRRMQQHVDARVSAVLTSTGSVPPSDTSETALAEPVEPKHLPGGPAVKFPHRRTALILGDTHFPWHHSEAIATVVAIAFQRQPDLILQVGDLYDMYSFSKFPRSHNLTTPADELMQARKHAAWMWERLRAAAPKARCYQLRGNHDERAYRRMIERAPELESLVGPAISDLWRFPGVETLSDANDSLLIDVVRYLHGYKNRASDHATFNRQNTVTGHLHRAEITWWEREDGHYFSFNVGFLADRHAPVFNYKAQKQLDRTTLGCGWLDDYGPRFILFPDPLGPVGPGPKEP